jgi:acylphosphatase
MPTVHLTIKGKVQGVFYRAAAKDIAETMGLTGWIRNTGEGNVEALATGPGEQVEAFINWCRKGPPKAIVTEVTIASKAEENFDRFRIVK